MTYFHILLGEHALVWSEGALSESLFVGTQTFETLGPKAMQEVAKVLPEAEWTKPAKPLLKGAEVRVLADAF